VGIADAIIPKKGKNFVGTADTIPKKGKGCCGNCRHNNNEEGERVLWELQTQ
jgi:hypothetical protein